MSVMASYARPHVAALVAAGWLVTCAQPSDGLAQAVVAVPLPTEASTPAEAGDNASPRVASGGAGHWIAVWHSSDTLGGTIGDDFDILISRSTDAGASWSKPSALNTNAAVDSGHDFRPHLASDGSGRWVVVWESEETLGLTVGPDADIFVSRSVDDGTTWTAPVALDSAARTDLGDDGRPQVVTDGKGTWLVAWHDEDPMGGPSGKDADLLVARSKDGGASWSAAVPLNSDAGGDTRADGFPRLSTDGQGRWVAVWAAEDLPGGPLGNDSDILVARSADGGATWTAPAPLNTNAGRDVGFDMYPRVATDGKGSWVVVWQSYDSLAGRIGEDADILVARSTDEGITWTSPAPLNAEATSDADYDLDATLATDGVGHWVAGWVFDDSWRKTGGTDTDLHVARSLDGGAVWTRPAALNAGAASDAVRDEAPEIATDGEGHWVAVWQQSRAPRGAAATTFEIVAARSMDDGASWAAPAAITLSGAAPRGPDHLPR